MTEDEVADNARQLVNSRLASMDHVEVLLHLFDARPDERDLASLSRATRLQERIAVKVLDDLVEGRLVSRTETGFVFDASSADREAVGELSGLYHTRPVTLVRAIYARPAPITTFAQTLRVRSDNERRTGN